MVKFVLCFIVGIAVLHEAFAKQGSGSLTAVYGGSTVEIPKRLLVGTINGGMHVLDAETGTVQWSLDTGESVVSSSGSIFPNTVVVPGVDGQLYITLSTGPSEGILQKLQLSVQDIFEACPFTTPEGHLVIAEKRSKAFVVDMQSGTLKMTLESDPTSKPVCQPIPTELQKSHSIVITRQDYNIRATDAYGHGQWNISVAEFTSAYPRMQSQSKTNEDGQYFSVNGSLYAIDPFSGSIQWMQELPVPPIVVFSMTSTTFKEHRVFPLSKLDTSNNNNKKHPWESAVAVSVHRGQLYARSVPSRIPFNLALLEDEDDIQNDRSLLPFDPLETSCSPAVSTFPGCLLGIHRVIDASNNKALMLLPARSQQHLLSNEDSSSSNSNNHNNNNHNNNNNRPTIKDNSGQQRPLIDFVKTNKTWSSASSAFSLSSFASLLSSYVPTFSKLGLSLSIFLTIAASAAVFLSFRTWLNLHRVTKNEKKQGTGNKGQKVIQHPAIGPPLIVSEVHVGDPAAMVPKEMATTTITIPILATTTTTTAALPTVVQPKGEEKHSEADNSSGDSRNKDDDITTATTTTTTASTTASTSSASKASKRRQRRKVQEDRREVMGAVIGQVIQASDDIKSTMIKIGKLSLPRDPKALGRGSHGTIVFQGILEPSRKVAVKRLLADFYEVADKEIELLIHSDVHPSVVRYYAKETDHAFVYLALELCDCSLNELVEHADWRHRLKSEEVRAALELLTDGIAHLHSVGIVHRDLKPPNVLVQHPLRFKISDMGLSKRLENDHSSFDTLGPGSLGWRAPEILRGDQRCTRGVDIFALGCLIYYTLTGGRHPFGDRVMREPNIVLGHSDLTALDQSMTEAKVLVQAMINDDHTRRPSATMAKNHPFYWSDQTKLSFLTDASDRIECEELTSDLVVHLESQANLVLPTKDWSQALDQEFLDSLGPHRKYNFSSVRDLLRIIRNKKNHYRDLPPALQHSIGPLPSGFLSYFSSRFPNLLMATHGTIFQHCSHDPLFKQYFK